MATKKSVKVSPVSPGKSKVTSGPLSEAMESFIADAVTAELNRREKDETERINKIRMPLMVMPPQKDLRDDLAMAALTGMLSHGTHHTPDKVMVMVYEFAEAGMVARARNELEKSGTLPCPMPVGHSNEAVRERCAQEVYRHMAELK